MITHDHELFKKYDWNMTYSEHGLDFEYRLVSEPNFLFMSLWYEVKLGDSEPNNELHCFFSGVINKKIISQVYSDEYFFFNDVLKYMQENEK